MDQTALVLCRDNKIKLRVYDMFRPGALLASSPATKASARWCRSKN